MPKIRSVIITLGSFNLLVIGLFVDSGALMRVAADQIMVLPGVRAIETSSVVKSLKYNERMAKLSLDRS